jgi:hypothetical protein
MRFSLRINEMGCAVIGRKTGAQAVRAGRRKTAEATYFFTVDLKQTTLVAAVF